MAEFSEESKELLELMKSMKIETKSDFEFFLRSQEADKAAQQRGESSASTKSPEQVGVADAGTITKFPCISLFYGEAGKGEVSY